MDAAEIAKRIDALEAGLAAKASRIADLETRVSLLEAENARLRKTMPNGNEMDHTGKKGTTFCRLEEDFGGNKQKPVDVVGGDVVNDVTEWVSDGEEEGMAVDDTTGRSLTWERTVPMVFGERVTEDNVGGGSDHEKVHCDDIVDLEDDDVSTIPCGKKRLAARVITSDSEDEDRKNMDDKVQEELGVTPSRKRLLRGLGDSGSDNEEDADDVRVASLKHVSCVAETGTENEDYDKDDSIPIREVIGMKRGNKGSRDDGELGENEINGCSTFTTKRSDQLVKTKAKRARVAQCGLEFVEPKECVESEDDSEQADSMHDFINDEGCSENSSEEFAEPEEPDSEVNYKDVMDCIGRRRNANANEWEYEADMLSAFGKQPELFFKAVCALYRKQTEEEQSEKASTVQNRQGFNQLDAVRASYVAEFLLDGDVFGPPKKTVDDLEKYDPDALEFCEKIAARYSKQLFAIYQNQEDPYFPYSGEAILIPYNLIRGFLGGFCT